MNELKELSLSQLDIISGGTNELIDTSYTNQLTAAEMNNVAIDTDLLVVNGGGQYIGKLKNVDNNIHNNSFNFSIKVERTSPGYENNIGIVWGFSGYGILVYSK